MTTNINNIYHVTNYLITQAHKKQIKDLTNLKLQKLLFYSYVYYLTLHNEDQNNLQHKLFAGVFSVLPYGPTMLEVYLKLRKYLKQPVKPIALKPNSFKPLTKSQQQAINYILELLGKKTITQLTRQIHYEEPWQNTFNVYSFYDEMLIKDHIIY